MIPIVQIPHCVSNCRHPCRRDLNTGSAPTFVRSPGTNKAAKGQGHDDNMDSGHESGEVSRVGHDAQGGLTRGARAVTGEKENKNRNTKP
jgi:hypothetical protein